MFEFLEDYWWLLFPFAWFVYAGWNSFMNYKRTQSKIDLLKTYAASGNEPPADLVANLEAADKGASDDWGDDSSDNTGNAFLVVLFVGLAGVFAYSGYSGLIAGVREEFYFVAMILGVLAVAFLANGLFSGGRRKK